MENTTKKRSKFWTILGTMSFDILTILVSLFT
jgi:hypothetical protein